MFEGIIRQRQTMQWHKADCFLGTTTTVTKSKTQTESTFECYSSLPVTHHTTTSHLIISKKRAQLSHYKDEQNAEYFYVITSDSGITIGKLGKWALS